MKRRNPVVAGVVLLALSIGLGSVVIGQSEAADAPSPSPGQAISDMVMEAWNGEYDEAEIEAIYAPDVIMMIDTDVEAVDRDDIRFTIGGAIHIGNTYRQVGPVIEYEDEEGDLYVASVVEVAGMGHPTGDPVIGFYRVRDGKVIRHIFMYAPDY